MASQGSAPLRREILSFIRRYSARPSPENAFNALALKLFRFQYDRNPFYRRYCEAEGTSPETVKYWKAIPAMPALAFREWVLTSFPPARKTRVFKTSGTTSNPSTGSGHGAHYFETLDIYKASIPPLFKRSLRPSGHSFYFLMESPQNVPHSSLSYMMGVVNERFGKGRGHFYVKKGRPLFGELLKSLKKERKKTIVCTTAFALKGFLDFLEEKNERLRLRPGSRLMETGGFKGRSREISKTELYGLCTRSLGIPRAHCVSEYGMTELSSQYYAAGGGPFKGPAWLRAVVVDPQNGRECPRGRIGILKHVDLANLGSVIAVQTEDAGRVVRGGFELLGRLPGSLPRGCSLSYEHLIGNSA